MKKFLSVLMAALMILGIAGCGQKNTSSSSASTSAAATGSAAVEQKPVTFILSVASVTSDPLNHSNLQTRTWCLNAFEPLLTVGYDSKTDSTYFDGRIADEWSISDDGLEYTFHIRDGVKFHSGRTCDAQAVKEAIEYAKTISYNQSYSGGITDIIVEDPSTVKLVLASPDAAFLTSLNRIYILDSQVIAEQGDAFGTKENLAGTGPYYIDSYDADVAIVLKRFDDYYRGPAQIPQVTFRISTDLQANLMAFEAGEVDFSLVGFDDYDRLEAEDKFTSYLASTTEAWSLRINPNASDVLGNKLVRQAIAYALDYDAINEATFAGYGLVNHRMMNPSTTVGCQPDDEYKGVKYEYNPTKAKELLAEAGYPNGVDVGDIQIMSGTWFTYVAQVAQQNLAAVNITSKLVEVDGVTAMSNMVNGNYGIAPFSYTYNVDFNNLSSDAGTVGEESHYTKIKHDSVDWQRIDELYVLGRETTDLDQREAYYGELESLLQDAAVQIPTFIARYAYMWNKDLYISTEHCFTYEYVYAYDNYWIA